MTRARRVHQSSTYLFAAPQKLFSTTTRKGFLHSIGFSSALTVSLLTIFPQPSAADISTQPGALKRLKSCQKRLESAALPQIQKEDYAVLRETLRLTPFSEMRKARTILKATTPIYQGEDPPPSLLEPKYREVIAGMEKMDSLAGLGVRGRKIPKADMENAYQKTVQAFAAFMQNA